MNSTFSLSSHRHPSMCILFRSCFTSSNKHTHKNFLSSPLIPRFIRYNKQQENILSLSTSLSFYPIPRIYVLRITVSHVHVSSPVRFFFSEYSRNSTFMKDQVVKLSLPETTSSTISPHCPWTHPDKSSGSQRKHSYGAKTEKDYISSPCQICTYSTQFDKVFFYCWRPKKSPKDSEKTPMIFWSPNVCHVNTLDSS